VALSLPVVWTDAHALHAPATGVWIGVPIPPDEVPERAARIRAELEAAGATIVPAQPYPDEALLAVHDASLVDFLRSAWKTWKEAGYVNDPGQDEVVGYLFPTPGFLGELAPRIPRSPAARTGAFCFDTMTAIGPGTWEAARAAVDCALTAAELVLAGAPVAYACCRPPGHHATREAYGGSCYLNNAAVAAGCLRARGIERLALLDLDAHHGNGAQSIFHDDGTVLTGSVHVDPGAGWFPHFLGFADESGPGNLNLPLPPGSGDEAWLEAVERLAQAARAHGSEALVLALGVDAHAADPNAPLEVSEEAFREAGRLLGALDLPTVVVQEGGYVLETIGVLVRAALEGIADA
jgi:acetoin utilization deacetylase AcuC-like enzyme